MKISCRIRNSYVVVYRLSVIWKIEFLCFFFLLLSVLRDLPDNCPCTMQRQILLIAIPGYVASLNCISMFDTQIPDNGPFVQQSKCKQRKNQNTGHSQTRQFQNLDKFIVWNFCHYLLLLFVKILFLTVPWRKFTFSIKMFEKRSELHSTQHCIYIYVYAKVFRRIYILSVWCYVLM